MGLEREGNGRDLVVPPDIESLARLQGGAVGGEQLIRCGWSRAVVRRRERQGVLQGLGGDVYSLGHRALARHGWHWAAALSAGPLGALSHWSAAFLWGLIQHDPNELHVSTPRGGRAGCRSSVVHRSRGFAEGDRTTRNGIPVTTILRTLSDLAASAAPADLRRMIEAAALKHGILPMTVATYARRSPRRPGAARLARAAHEVAGPVLLRSGLETMFRTLMEEAGIGLPETNVPFRRWELDAYWRALAVAVELDWHTTHLAQRNYRVDRRKGMALARAGIELIRVAGEDMEDCPREVVATVLAVLQAHAAQRGLRVPSFTGSPT